MKLTAFLTWIVAASALFGGCKAASGTTGAVAGGNAVADAVGGSDGSTPPRDVMVLPVDDAGAPDANAATDANSDPCQAVVPNLHSDPKKLVRNLHQTWQHDAATTVTISWTTEHNELATYKPQVLVAPASIACAGGNLLVAKGTVVTGAGVNYTALLGASDVKLVAWHVELTGLVSDTDYVFRAGTSGSIAATGTTTGAEMSGVGKFRTAPAKGTRKPMAFVVAGDSRGGTAKIKANSEFFTSLPALAWFFSGDMNPTGVQTEWNSWFDAMAPVLRDRPLMPVQGNHEIFAEVYYTQFALPAMPGLAADYTEHGWSLNVGNVHFVGLDSNSEEACIDQASWLTSDLKKAQLDPDIDWTVVQFHHAAYSSSSHGSTKYVQKQWVPLFDKYGVDLVFNGHDHNYERSVPILANKAVDQDKGVTYVVAGGFFAPGYGNGKNWWTVVSHHGNKNNFVQLLVDGKKFQVTAWSGDGKTKLDEFELTR